MIDGDGTIMLPKGKHGPVLSLVGSEAVMHQFAAFLESALILTKRPRVYLPHRQTVMYEVKKEGVAAREAIALLWHDVYSQGTTKAPALERKLSRVAAALNWSTRTERGECARQHSTHVER
jgi:hypothetical protein